MTVILFTEQFFKQCEHNVRKQGHRRYQAAKHLHTTKNTAGKYECNRLHKRLKIYFKEGLRLA